jgi:hypothetical protein
MADPAALYAALALAVSIKTSVTFPGRKPRKGKKRKR